MPTPFVVPFLAFLIPYSTAVCNSANLTGKIIGETSRFQQLPKSDLYRCASDCLRSSICKAFDFGLSDRICSLYMQSTDEMSVENNPDFIYGNIGLWPKVSVDQFIQVLCYQKLLLKSVCIVCSLYTDPRNTIAASSWLCAVDLSTLHLLTTDSWVGWFVV